MVAAPVSATDHTINPEDSVNDAISSAGSGDTIILNPGTYYEHDISIDKDIVIRANTSIGGSASDTVIDAGMAGRIINLTGGFSLDIDNLTLLNGYTDGININGGAINAGFSGSTITVTASSVSNSSAYDGGAIYAGSGSTVSILSSSISNCRAGGNGGAISADSESTLTISSSLITHCGAGFSGGAIASKSITLTIISSTITDCSAYMGGAITTFRNLTIADSLITDSSATYGGGAIASYGGDISLTSTILSNCSAPEGGAIYSSYGGDVNSTNSTFSGCSGKFGSAIYSDSGNLTVDSSTFVNCSGDQSGAISFLSAGTANITSSVFENCSATFGGAIETYQVGTLVVDSSTFSNCSAGNDGGAIVSSSEITIITSTSFTNCSSADDGGAISFGSGRASIDSSTFSHCSAGNTGGAIYDFGGTVTITGTSFSRCAAHGYGGGAIFAHGAIVNISSSAFTNCSAKNYGGAINCEWGSIATIDSSTLSNGSAGTGGAIFSRESTVHNHFSRFSNNSGTVVINNAGTFDATNNWWGTNADPSDFTEGGVTVSPWLVLRATAIPSSLSGNQPATIRVNLTRNSAGTDTAGSGIFVPDGIPVAFARTSGTGSIMPQAGTIRSGSNSTIFTPAGTGNSTISATVDGQTVSVKIVTTVLKAPVANFTATPRAGTAPLTVSFTDTSQNTPTQRIWTFGDGSLAWTTQKNHVHTFTKAGTYTVSLNVSNAAGYNLTIKTGYITVTAPPPAVTGITPASGVRGRLTEISNLSGTGFAAGAAVSLSRTGWPPIYATNVTVVNAKRITCTFAIPAGAPLGYRNIVVKNLGGNPGTKGNAFLVKAPAAPTVNALDPATGPRGSLVTVTNLSGAGFVAVPTPKVQLVRNGTVIAAGNVTVVNGRRISCTFAIPAEAVTGAWHARVTNGDQQSGVRNRAFTVL